MEKSIQIQGLYYAYTSSADLNREMLSNSHCHDEYEILFVVQGVGRCIVEGREYPIKPYTLLLMSPFEYHHVEIDEDVSIYERYILHFSSSVLTEDGEKILNAILNFYGDSGVYYPPHTITSQIVSLFGRFEYAHDMPERQKGTYMPLVLSELMVFLSITRADQLPRSSEELGARVVRYLNENIDRDISLDTLSRRFFVSKYYLCRAFKKHNGVSIHGYINHKRIIYAKHLIDAGEAASVAAYKVGFGDYSAFYRAYVKILGMSPTAIAGKKNEHENS